MDVRVEAGVCSAGAVMHEVHTTVELLSGVIILAPVVTRFSLTPVISVGGTSISSITPVNELIGVKA
jgi:hypothetical protein